jgi:bifunctional enzyme CysN/CysC
VTTTASGDTGLAARPARRAGDVAPSPRNLGGTVWFTGLSGAGKSTVAVVLGSLLASRSVPFLLLDGDELRKGLSSDLGFSSDDRIENVRRASEVAKLYALSGHLAIVSMISPFAAGRLRARALHEDTGIPFVEVYVATPRAVCEARDPKGMYARARRGEIARFTGVSDPYEPPEEAEVVLQTSDQAPEESALEVLAALEVLGLA